MSPTGPSQTGPTEDHHLIRSEPWVSARGVLHQMPFSPGCWNEMLFSELIQRGTTRWRQTPAMSRSNARQGPPPAQTSLCLRFPAPGARPPVNGGLAQWTVGLQPPLSMKFSRQEWVAILFSGGSYWSFSFSPSNEYSGLISFKID